MEHDYTATLIEAEVSPTSQAPEASWWDKCLCEWCQENKATEPMLSRPVRKWARR